MSEVVLKLSQFLGTFLILVLVKVHSTVPVLVYKPVAYISSVDILLYIPVIETNI